jgi:hypothetical protein
VEKARHHSVATSPVPDEHAARLEHTRELCQHFSVVGRSIEKAKRREQIDDRVESTIPGTRKASHIAPPIAQLTRRDSATVCSFRHPKQIGRQVDAIDAPSRFSQQARVPTLPAGAIENPCSGGEIREQVDDSPRLSAVAGFCEERFILTQVVLVEMRGPPRSSLSTPEGQKNTGSRYAPNTLSRAARISYRVQ